MATRAEAGRRTSLTTSRAQPRRRASRGSRRVGVCVDDDEVRRSVLGHQLCGALHRLVRRDHERGGGRRRAGGLLVEIADARSRGEIEVGDDAPERPGVPRVVGHDDAVDTVGRHELGDVCERRLPRHVRTPSCIAAETRMPADAGSPPRWFDAVAVLSRPLPRRFVTGASRSATAPRQRSAGVAMWRTTAPPCRPGSRALSHLSATASPRQEAVMSDYGGRRLHGFSL